MPDVKSSPSNRHLALTKHPWPSFPQPTASGDLTAADVMHAASGPDYGHAIDAWCWSVGDAFRESHHMARTLLRQYTRE